MLLTKDKDFYRTFWRLFFMIVLQNAIVLSVNLADNLMIGGYSETALSGVAAVNSLQFLFQQLTIGIGDALVTMGSQYWGQGRTAPIKQIGKTVGKGDMDKLREYVRTFQCIFLCISLVTGVMPFAIAL